MAEELVKVRIDGVTWLVPPTTIVIIPGLEDRPGARERARKYGSANAITVQEGRSSLPGDLFVKAKWSKPPPGAKRVTASDASPPKKPPPAQSPIGAARPGETLTGQPMPSGGSTTRSGGSTPAKPKATAARPAPASGTGADGAPTAANEAPTAGATGGQAAPSPAAAGPPAVSAAAPTLHGIGPGVELWDVDGRVLVVDRLPSVHGAAPVPIGWHVKTIKELEALLGPTANRVPIRRVSGAEWRRAGGQLADRPSSSLISFDGDPAEQFLRDFEREAQIFPWLRDPEVLAVHYTAFREGRKPTEAEFKTTTWWRGHTDLERQALLGWATDPATAARKAADAVISVRNLFVNAGDTSPSESLVRYYADQLSHGKLSETALRDMVLREVDPFVPGASPYAGRTLPDGHAVVTDGTKSYIRNDEGLLWELDEAGAARFGASAQRAAPQGETLLVGERLFLRTPDGKTYEATGPGQMREAVRLYGDPRVATLDDVGAVSGSMIEFYRSQAADPAARMEDFAPELSGQPVGRASDFFSDQPRSTVPLGRETTVRDLLSRYLGPYYAQQYNEQWVAEWAGRLRLNPVTAEEQLRDLLQNRFDAAFPQYRGMEFTYADVAPIVKGEAARWYGSENVPETEEWFLRAMQITEPDERNTYLRKQGLQRGWEPTVRQFTESTLPGIGASSHRRPIGV